MKIAIATKNLGKLKEFQELSKETDYELLPIPEDIKELPPETGETFYENALIKAKFISEVLGIPAIGDDSGLEVDILNGEPGVYSARYSDSGRDSRQRTVRWRPHLIAKRSIVCKIQHARWKNVAVHRRRRCQW